MKKWIFLLLLGLSGLSLAKPHVVDLDAIQPTQEQRLSSVTIARLLERWHYTQPSIDNHLSRLAFNRYLDTLDANRSFFTVADVESFEDYRDALDDNLLSGHIEPAFVIFKRFRQKVEQRVAYALRLLDEHAFDFTVSEEYRFDRTDTPWAKDESVLDEVWRKRVKNDILSARLADEDYDPASLRKRYEGILSRVQQMTGADVFQAFVNAFALSIEPHTSYMSPRLSENFDIGMRLSLQGIGAVLRGDNEYTQVVRTVVGGPAAKSGKLHGGDRIIGVAQGAEGQFEDVVGWRLQDVVELIRGPKDSVVRLKVLPKSEGLAGRSRVVMLTREKIKLEDKAAKAQVLDGEEFGGKKIGVIDIPAFYRDFAAQAAGDRNFRSTTRDVRALLTDLESQGVDGLIIDLRQNGGGSLAEATELTGLFIDEGPVVQVKDVNGNVDVERDVDPEQVYAGPLLVLVDRNSASASEIFAGAIQDYDRGLIVGEPTFGKGTVQTLINLQRHLGTEHKLGRLRLTMAQFFRVAGASTQHRGVTPDVVFPTARGASEHGERGLEHAIPWASIRPAVNKGAPIKGLSALRSGTRKRIAHDPGFRFLMDTEDELIEVREDKYVTLNEQQRRTERAEREARLLASRNRLRAYRGLPALTKLDDEPDPVAEDKDEEGINRIMLDESARILVDYIKTLQPMTAQVAG